MLKMISTKFRELYPVATTDEQRAEMFLDDLLQCNGTYALSKKLEIDPKTCQKIAQEIMEDNRDFYEAYLTRMTARVQDFKSTELGQNLYSQFKDEIDACEENYQTGITRLYRKNAQDEFIEVEFPLKEARLWKTEKHKLMETMLKIHVDLLKQDPKGGDEDGKGYKNDLDSQLARAAQRLQ